VKKKSQVFSIYIKGTPCSVLGASLKRAKPESKSRKKTIQALVGNSKSQETGRIRVVT